MTRRWLGGVAAGLGTLGAVTADASLTPAGRGSERAVGGSEYDFHQSNVLGTSMDLVLQTPDAADAEEGRRCVLREIHRLAGILSTYDPVSDISRAMRGEPVQTPELSAVLGLYQIWQERTVGAVHVNLAAVKQLWAHAAQTGHLPSETDLRQAFRRPCVFNVDALGKAFIIDRVVEAARGFAPAGLLDIGGEIRVWGDRSWRIGVADPQNPAENALPIMEFYLREAAVATSGGYARNLTIRGRRYSHVIDARTLRPASIQAAASIIADDCLTANAVATAACVLEPDAASHLAEAYASGYLLCDASGVRGGGTLATPPGGARRPQSLPASAPAAPVSRPAADRTSNWADRYQLLVGVALKPGFLKFKRPYVAVWIEDQRGKLVRNLSVWGTKEKYLPELSAWWKANQANTERAMAVTRATRSPGRYALAWDGRDQDGRMVEKGTYRVCIEINREHGRHTRQAIPITCGDKPISAVIPATAESNESRIDYQSRGDH